MVGRYRFEFILIILVFYAHPDCRPFLSFPDCSYLILLPLSSRPVYSIYEGLLLIIIITHQSVICVQPLL